jgi:RHS repeat-associated protein
VGRATRVEDPLGNVTAYSYDAAGNLSSVTDANGHATVYRYDNLERLVGDEDALGRARTITYDDAGQPSRIVDRNGIATTFTRGPDGQMTSRRATDGSFQDFEYDPLGRLVVASSAVARVSFSWDDSSRQTGEAIAPVNGSGIPTATISGTWTDAGQRASSTDPFGSIAYLYDTQGRLQSLTASAVGSFTFDYDSVDRVTKLTRPNGISDVYSYAGARLASHNLESAQATLESWSYEFGPLGLPSTITDTNGQTNYSHDALGRLTGATHASSSGISDETYSYDGVGNRTSWSGNASALVSYDAANRLLSDGRFTYVYDNEGRLTTRTDRSTGAVTRYSWNGLGQLVAVALPDATVVGYGYDALGRRVETTTGGTPVEYVIYDGLNPRLVYDGSGILRTRYVDGLGLNSTLAAVATTGVTYPVIEGLGTVVASLDASGAIAGQYSYDSFGNPAPGTTATDQHAWQGLAPDSAGTYDVHARTYDPSTGRFISEDPIPSDNAYAYALNSPLAATDPTGLCATVEYSEINSETKSSAPQICAQGSLLEGAFADIATDMTFAEVMALAPGTQGLYAFAEGGQSYVGQSVDIRRRILEHLGDQRLGRGSRVLVLQLQDLTSSALRDAEQLAIRDCGGKLGITNLTNKINARKQAIRDDLQNLYSTLGGFLP